MTIKLNENERLDDLILDGMKLIQRNDEFCFSLAPRADRISGIAAVPVPKSKVGPFMTSPKRANNTVSSSLHRLK